MNVAEHHIQRDVARRRNVLSNLRRGEALSQLFPNQRFNWRQWIASTSLGIEQDGTVLIVGFLYIRGPYERFCSKGFHGSLSCFHA